MMSIKIDVVLSKNQPLLYCDNIINAKPIFLKIWQAATICKSDVFMTQIKVWQTATHVLGVK